MTGRTKGFIGLVLVIIFGVGGGYVLEQILKVPEDAVLTYFTVIVAAGAVHWWYQFLKGDS